MTDLELMLKIDNEETDSRYKDMTVQDIERINGFVRKGWVTTRPLEDFYGWQVGRVWEITTKGYLAINLGEVK